MAMIQINKNPSAKELRVFGMLFIAFAGVFGLLMLWRGHSMGLSQSIWLVGAIIGALYFLVARLQKPIYLGWCYATYPIGFVVSHVIMIATFYLAVTPVGLVLRLMGKDLLQQKLDRAAKTYWTPHDPAGHVNRYFRQF